MKSSSFFNLLFLLVNSFTNLNAQNTQIQLPVLNPDVSGLKPQRIEKIVNRAFDSIPSLGSILVYKDSGIVYKKFFNNCNDSTIFELKSATKSVTSILAGAAKDRGLFPALNSPVWKLFPEYYSCITQTENVWFPDLMSETDSLKKIITVHDLLSMQTGYYWDDQNFLSHRVFQVSSDPVRYILDLPYQFYPGTRFNYCTAASHLVGVLIERSVKTDLRTFADSTVFHPIGINVGNWTKDAKGHIAGGSQLSLTAADMLRLGILYLNKGKCGGKQIISESWINESTALQAELNYWDVLPEANGYGYFWWRRVVKGKQAIVASGLGGQLICIIPELKVVITTTCLFTKENRGRSEIKRIHELVINELVSEIIHKGDK